MKSASELKQIVKEKYGNLARSGGCCGTGDQQVCSPVGMGYSYEQLVSIPDQANLNVGCGNPTELAALDPGMVVLDLGAGAGIDVFLAARKVGPAGRVIGVDMTEAMVSKARENARRAGINNVEFRLGDIENLPVEENSIDVILSNCVINLAPDKDRVFAEAYRVLRPSGRLQISDIVTRGTSEDLEHGDPRLWADCISGALNREVYLAKLSGAGFRDIRILQEFEYDAYKTDDFSVLSLSLTATK
ncbi:MAG TPA: arsenite methyltransferase [Acidobacteriota bacterium]|jgi:SAM-dependent methyltransferase